MVKGAFGGFPPSGFGEQAFEIFKKAAKAVGSAEGNLFAYPVLIAVKKHDGPLDRADCLRIAAESRNVDGGHRQNGIVEMTIGELTVHLRLLLVGFVLVVPICRTKPFCQFENAALRADATAMKFRFLFRGSRIYFPVEIFPKTMLFETLQSADAAALNAFRSFVDHDSAWQVSAIRFFSDIEVLVTAALLVAIWLDARFRRGNDENRKKDALAFFYAVMAAFALYWILNFGLPARPRPESVSALRPLIDHLPDNSFPSGHGMFAGASFMAAYLLFDKKVFAFALLAFGIPMLAARVLSGIHYPGDVLVGFFLGVVLVKLLMPHVNSHRLRSSPVYAFPLRIAAFLKL